MRRRLFVWITSAQLVPRRHAFVFAQANRGEMYGLISKIIAVAGKREELIAILLGSISDMPGCLSYIIARDTTPDLKFVRARHFADKEVSTGRLLLDGNQVAAVALALPPRDQIASVARAAGDVQPMRKRGRFRRTAFPLQSPEASVKIRLALGYS